MVLEIWKYVVGYIRLYMVSSYGRVKSLNYNRMGKEQILKLGKDRDGYLQVRLYKNGVGKGYKVHRLVLEAFVSSCPDGMQRCHNDGNKENNRVENLRYDTQSGNMQDKNRHGTMPNQKGSNNNSAKLNDWIIRIVRRLLEAGDFTQKEIGEMFGVSHQAISKIKTKKNWKESFIGD